MRSHHRSQSVAEAKYEIEAKLVALQREHGLSDVEMLQAITSWQGTVLKYMLRIERHPDDPGKPADEE